ncbi:hypothetical protein AVEN_180189-1 [Araneus ventricosus]|uniref:Uncharacterized protein n=1 Tax=Araneus ventricosus TaxID=182803 RepID=A0A4Y2T9T8_ARAVE|nr:hypothetical protein AVEN_174914-1 [Araneus ventricosus]GBN96573.1 hypothetical protein AVEN_180189-1 [Araneus ventricosus]
MNAEAMCEMTGNEATVGMNVGMTVLMHSRVKSDVVKRLLLNYGLNAIKADLKCTEHQDEASNTDLKPKWHGYIRCPKKVEQAFISLNIGPRWPSGKVPTSGPEGRRFRNPIPPKIRRVWGLLHAKPYAVAKRPPVGVARKLGEGCASPGVVLVI